MSFTLYHTLSFVFICKRVEENRFGYEETFQIYAVQFCSNKLNNCAVKIETVLQKAGNFISPNEISPKIDENGKGVTQSPLSLQSVSQVTRDYGMDI